MVGATAFMETLELALELRRAGYGDGGERLGFDLYPYTEDQVARCALGAAVALHRRRRGKIDDAALREAQQAQGRGPRLRAGLRGARRAVTALAGLDVGTTAVKGLALDTTARWWPAPRTATRFDPQARLDRAGPGALVEAAERVLDGLGGRAPASA